VMTCGARVRENMMLKLVAVIYIMVGSMLAGSFVVAALTLDRMDAVSISIAALIGAIVAMPVSWFIAKKLDKAIRPA
jgi:quinol-cytochrome oxidoreductase complex cytochrome b subunit